mmetsp:Transcript_12449/g.36148  ORF Transcript_12449/g.36148 Transcript_12449/m.36148 type:complete len:226 (-) Transcript_12449:177-854(-)
MSPSHSSRLWRSNSASSPRQRHLVSRYSSTRKTGQVTKTTRCAQTQRGCETALTFSAAMMRTFPSSFPEFTADLQDLDSTFRDQQMCTVRWLKSRLLTWLCFSTSTRSAPKVPRNCTSRQWNPSRPSFRMSSIRKPTSHPKMIGRHHSWRRPSWRMSRRTAKWWVFSSVPCCGTVSSAISCPMTLGTSTWSCATHASKNSPTSLMVPTSTTWDKAISMNRRRRMI